MMFGLLIILIIGYFLLRHENANMFAPPGNQRNALEILQERFARGEISAEEFNERKRVLEQ